MVVRVLTVQLDPYPRHRDERGAGIETYERDSLND